MACMSERMSLYPTKKLKTAVKKLAEMQRRSESEMAIILIEEGLRVFRNEWKRTGGTVPSNPKPISLKAAWDAEASDEFGN